MNFYRSCLIIERNISNYRDVTSFNTHYFQLFKLYDSFIEEHSETSDNRPYTASNIISETSFNEYDQSILQSDTDQNNLQLNSDNNTDILQNPQPQQQENITHDQQQNTTLQTLPDSSDTDTMKNVSDLSDINTNNPQSLTITNDSNVL